MIGLSLFSIIPSYMMAVFQFQVKLLNTMPQILVKSKVNGSQQEPIGLIELH